MGRLIDMTEGEAEYLKYRFKQYLGSVSRAIQNKRLEEQKMGMTIDEDPIYVMGYNRGFKNAINASSPKADYEARLKADMVAMFTEIQLEIEEKKFLESSCSFMDKTEEKNYAVYTDDISNIIQQKIDALKGAGGSRW